MAAVIDFVSDSSRFHPHTMIPGAGHHGSSEDSPYRQSSRSRVEPPPSPKPHPTSINDGTPPPSANPQAKYGDSHDVDRRKVKSEPISPPSSSSPNPDSYIKQPFTSQQNVPSSSAPYARSEISHTMSTDSTLKPSRTASAASERSTPRTAKSLDDVQTYGGNTIKVRDLAHIESFASEEFLSFRGQSGRPRTADDPGLKYEISGMPITDIIEMVAGLLTKITTTNDRQHETLQRSMSSTEHTANLTGLSSSVLAFHGKNVPSITILSYLTRIHKYCPTTYEVFLSLLVYFDRMTERVNATPMSAVRGSMDQDASRPPSTYSAEDVDLADTPPGARSVPELRSEIENAQYTHSPGPEPGLAQFPLSHFFVVDSFNIHRLVIAGVTCASKFFSDVFYTNSRYAKVGGLPLNELNHLELQFLLLNDFRLSVPVEELEAYGTMLVEFYAREVLAQKQANGTSDMAYPQDTAS